jgi:hypothetical protein
VIVDPIPPQNGLIVRDHRDSVTIFNPAGGKTWTVGPTMTPPPLSNNQGSVTVPRGGGRVVRDHRSGLGASGGVTVTTTPGGGRRDNAITGSGPNPIELLAEGAAKVGNVLGIGSGEITAVGGSAASGPTIRDHRSSGPIVRDHRDGQ